MQFSVHLWPQECSETYVLLFHGTSAAIRMCISLNPSLNHWNPALKKYDSGVHHLLGFEPKTNSPNPGRSMPQLSTKKRREGWSGAPAHEHRGILPGWNNSLGMDPNTVLKRTLTLGTGGQTFWEYFDMKIPQHLAISSRFCMNYHELSFKTTGLLFHRVIQWGYLNILTLLKLGKRPKHTPKHFKHKHTLNNAKTTFHKKKPKTFWTIPKKH